MAAAATNWVICIALLLSLSFGMCAVRRSFRLSTNLRLRQAANNINTSTTLSQSYVTPPTASNISNSTSTLQPNFNSSALFPGNFFGQSGWFQRCEGGDDAGNVDCTCYPEGPSGCGYFDCNCDFNDEDDGNDDKSGGDDDKGGGDSNSTMSCDFVHGCLANWTNYTTHLVQDLTQKLVAKGLLEY